MSTKRSSRSWMVHLDNFIGTRYGPYRPAAAIGRGDIWDDCFEMII